MQVQILWNDLRSDWEIFGYDPEIGITEFLGHAEGVQLKDAEKFIGMSFNGQLTAIFGAQFREGVLEEGLITKRLALGKTFREHHRKLKWEEDYKVFVDTTDGVATMKFPHLCVMGKGAYYSTKVEMMNADRYGIGHPKRWATDPNSVTLPTTTDMEAVIGG